MTILKFASLPHKHISRISKLFAVEYANCQALPNPMQPAVPLHLAARARHMWQLAVGGGGPGRARTYWTEQGAPAPAPMHVYVCCSPKNWREQSVMQMYSSSIV